MSGNATALLALRTQEALMRRPTFRYLAALNESQWASRASLLTLQQQRLNELLACALAHSPWHSARLRAHGLAGAIAARRLSREAFCTLPTMTRDDARRHGDLMVWPAVPGGVQAYSTGGSSGEPLEPPVL